MDRSRWLVVVQREHPELYRHLRERLEGVTGVEVVLDQRTRDRRVPAGTAETGRRGEDRRRLPPMRDRGTWSGLGFRLVRDHPSR